MNSAYSKYIIVRSCNELCGAELILFFTIPESS